MREARMGRDEYLREPPPLEVTALPHLAVAADSRVSIRANGVRGLVALQQTTPAPENAAIIASHADDLRIAVQLALAGVGGF